MARNTAAAAIADDEPSFKTLPDIARSLRGMADGLAAEEFMLCLRASNGKPGAFACVMDSAYPGDSRSARALVQHLPEWVSACPAASPIPLWWTGYEGNTPEGAEELEWAERIDLPSSTAGLLLPLCTERGAQGLLIFRGNAISVREVNLAFLQARCFGMFTTVANIWPLHDRPMTAISRRELECLKLTASGNTSEEIGRLLGLSVHTTNQYLANTMQKLNAVNRVHAVAKAIREGLIA